MPNDNDYVKAEKVILKTNPRKEYWVRDILVNDPSILGLGNLEFRGKEIRQPRAGRLDLLLQDRETTRRYEVEIQLGSTDPSHIIRTIEYWDIERKRYPQYDHCAVLIAEDITSRFLNVISLFNGTIPFIAIQMSALRVEGKMTLVFTKVLDEMSRGLVDADEDAELASADRPYWEKKATKETMGWIDELLALARNFNAGLELNYTKNYIGLLLNGEAYNFVSFNPKRQHVNLEIRLPKSDELDATIDEGGGDSSDYSPKWERYILRLREEDIKNKKDFLRDMMQKAYDRRQSS